MVQSNHSDPQTAGSRPKGCFSGGALTFLGGLALVAVGSLVAFIVLPRLIQGPLDLGASKGIGQRLPDLQLVPLTGTDQPVTLADLAGKVAVINFWGTWCPPCRMELPDIAELEREFRGRADVAVLAVSCGQGRREQVDQLRLNTQRLLDESGIDMPSYADPTFVTRGAFDAAAGFEGYPTTFVLDRQGTIRGIWVGFDKGMPAELHRLLDELLQENP